jgi:cellulose biosynthesis protein BcsQ
MKQDLELSQQIKNLLIQELHNTDPNAEVNIKRTSLGWLKLQVITTTFRNKNLPEREQQIDDLLAALKLDLGQYPFSNYDLLTPLELNVQSSEFMQLPLWSELLMAPEPDQAFSLEEDFSESGADNFIRPLIITFYSFKGGVGRSTALGIVAGLLVRKKRRVVMIDLDLEAPGISVLFKVEEDDSTKLGALDYLHQRLLTPEQNIPTIDDCIQQIELTTRGELYLIPAGEYNENYIHRLADLNVRTFYHREKNPFKELIEDIKTKLNPDVILIDSRTGFSDIGAIALLDLADTGIICFSPSDQSFSGLNWVVQAANKQYKYKGQPDLRFVLTPMPQVDRTEQDRWEARFENWIEKNWGVPITTNVKELYCTIPYNPSINVLTDLVNNIPEDLISSYQNIATWIDASLPPDPKLDVAHIDSKNYKNILSELNFRTATAQEMNPSDLPNIFQRTDDFPKFLSDQIWLIRGAKGTGKSLLFRLFVEHVEVARNLARSDANLSPVNFIPSHGSTSLRGPVLNSGDLLSYERQIGNDYWQSFWLNYALLQLCHYLPGLREINGLSPELVQLSIPDETQHSAIIEWLVERAKSAQAGPQANDELILIDRWLQSHKLRAWLLYDELDAVINSTQPDYYIHRKRVLEALFSWWLENVPNLKCIVPKILLREDIWNRLNFTNKGHYVGHSLPLRWEEEDLWRLVLRQALISSTTLVELLANQFGFKFKKDQTDNLDALELEQLQKSLYPLWGMRMGRNKKAYTYNWVRSRIADSKNNCFPRSLILLLQRASEIEKGYSTPNLYETVLRPKALIDALPFVSAQRVAEVLDEYPEFEDYLRKLRGERSPIGVEHLSNIWGIKNSALDKVIKDMLDAGIFQERPETSSKKVELINLEGNDFPRYAIAELYLYGLGMIRKGQR